MCPTYCWVAFCLIPWTCPAVGYHHICKGSTKSVNGIIIQHDAGFFCSNVSKDYMMMDDVLGGLLIDDAGGGEDLGRFCWQISDAVDNYYAQWGQEANIIKPISSATHSHSRAAAYRHSWFSQ
jgi:hypothetical protein